MIDGQAPVAGQSGDVNPAPLAASAQSTPAEAVAGVAELNREQTTMIGWIREDLALGKMTQEQADQAIREATGRDPKDVPSDCRSESERAYDLAHPKATASQIPWPHTDETITPEFTAFKDQVNNYFTSAGMTKETAGYILREADKFGWESEKWTPEQHMLFGRSEVAKLQALWGDKTAERIQMAKNMVQQLEKKQPGIVALLEKTGLGNHSSIIVQVVHHAERLSKRSSKP